MNKQTLHAKHQEILKPEGKALLSDLAAHMRMSTPATPPETNPEKQMDTTHVLRRSGWIDGWLTACNYLEVIQIPDVPTPQKQEQPQNYVAPVNKAAEAQPQPTILPPPNLPDFTKPEAK